MNSNTSDILVRDKPQINIQNINTNININAPITCVFEQTDKEYKDELRFLKHLSRLLSQTEKSLAICFIESSKSIFISANSFSQNTHKNNHFKSHILKFIEDLKESKYSKLTLECYDTVIQLIIERLKSHFGGLKENSWQKKEMKMLIFLLLQEKNVWEVALHLNLSELTL